MYSVATLASTKGDVGEYIGATYTYAL